MNSISMTSLQCIKENMVFCNCQFEHTVSCSVKWTVVQKMIFHGYPLKSWLSRSWLWIFMYMIVMIAALLALFSNCVPIQGHSMHAPWSLHVSKYLCWINHCVGNHLKFSFFNSVTLPEQACVGHFGHFRLVEIHCKSCDWLSKIYQNWLQP